MKKRLLFCLPLSAVLLAGIFTSALFHNNSVNADAIGNYSTDASTYYNGITATSGKQLAAQLHDLITRTHLYYTSYDDNGKNLYQQKTDQYYENGQKVNGYIYEFYSGVKWPNGWDATAGRTSGGYNREHCWCQSNSVNTSGKQMWGTTGGGADMHHIRPVECRLNSSRNNHPYGEITNRDSYKSYAKFGTNETYAHGGYTNGDADIFEPLDSKKGDVARIILYTYLHYNSYTVSDLFGSYGTTDGSGSSDFFSSSLLSLTKTSSQTTEAKALEMFLRWNSSDPVDDIERRRNEQVAVYQGNRNPFIDNSAYADAIWGTSTGITSISKTNIEMTTEETTSINAVSSNGGNITWTTSNSSVCSLSTTTSSSGSNITLTAVGVGSATITAKITISGTTYSKTCEVTVSAPKTLSSISVGNDAKISYKIGDSFVRPTITATYSDSTTKDVTNNATFSGYDLSTTGQQTVSVSYTENGGTKTTSYTINVSETSESVYYEKCTSMSDIENGGRYVLIGKKNENYYAMPSYTSGNNIKGVAVTLTENGTKLTEENMSTAAVYTFESTGTENQFYIGDGSLYLFAAGSETSNYLKGKDSKDPSNGAFTISYTTFFSLVAASENRNTMRFNPNGNNNPIFSCYANNDSQSEVMLFKETSAGPTPIEPELISISLDTSNVQTEFVVGETFNYDNLIVIGNYSDTTSEDLDSYDVSNPDMTTIGEKTITVTYNKLSATYSINVKLSRTLSSITISGQKTSYYIGDIFSFTGTCTAHYSDETSSVVMPTNVSIPDMTTAGEKTITVSYTEGSVTETAEYQITVRESGSSVTITVSIADYATSNNWINGTKYPSISLDDVATAEVNNDGGNTGKYYTTGNEWRFYQTESASIKISVLDGYELESITLTYNVTNTGALFDGDTQLSSGTPIVASGTSEIYTVGNSASATNGQVKITSISVTYRLPASLTSISLDTSNVQKVFSVGDTFNYTGLVVTAHYSDSSTKTVTPTSVSSPNMSTTGNKTVTVTYTEDENSKTADYSITVNANPSISWTAPTINVYSGSTLSGNDVNGWAVTYNDGEGHQTTLTYSQLTVKLGGTTISIPHTWSAEDDGKTLTVTYNSLTTNASDAVQITQSVNTITKTSEPSTVTSNLTFTGSCGGSGTADNGATWTVTSDATESAYDSTKGIHYGTGSAAVEYIELVSNSFTAGTITQVVVNASGASGVTGSVSVTVGGNAFGEVQSFNATASDKTFTGTESAGQIVVRIYKASAAVKAIYCKSVVVTNNVPGSSTVISNSVDHIAAQRVAVKFAKAFNTAMDTTNGCTTNLSTAWSTCSSAYNTFLSEAAALGEDEELYAKNLIRFATAQYSDNSGEACIERMMKTYAICVQKHGQNPFMSTLVTLERFVNNPLQINSENINSLVTVIIISTISIALVSGYFLIRRKKEK